MVKPRNMIGDLTKTVQNPFVAKVIRRRWDVPDFNRKDKKGQINLVLMDTKVSDQHLSNIFVFLLHIFRV